MYFMTVYDWTRTEEYKHEDGSRGLSYNHIKVAMFEIFMFERHKGKDVDAYIQDNSYSAAAKKADAMGYEYKDDKNKQDAQADIIRAGAGAHEQF